MSLYPNLIRTRFGPDEEHLRAWRATTRHVEPTPSETFPDFAHRHLEQDVAPVLESSDQFLHTEWISGGELVEVDTQQGVTLEDDPDEVDPNETRAQHVDRHEAKTVAKLAESPVDS